MELLPTLGFSIPVGVAHHCNPSLERLRQEDCHELQASLHYRMSHFLRKQTLKVLGLDL